MQLNAPHLATSQELSWRAAMARWQDSPREGEDWFTAARPLFFGEPTDKKRKTLPEDERSP